MPNTPRTTGFTSMADYINANQGTIANEDAALNGDVNTAVGNAQTAADGVIAQAGVDKPDDYTTTKGYGDALGKIQDAQQTANELGSTGGLADLLQAHYGPQWATYDTADANMDAGFLGVQPNSAAATKAAGLTDYLNSGAAAAAVKPPVVVAPPPDTGGDAPPEPKDPETPATPPNPTHTPGTPTYDPDAPPKTFPDGNTGTDIPPPTNPPRKKNGTQEE
jgi:hypothetical protein